MKSSRHSVVALLFALFCASFSSFASAETVELVTYYPAVTSMGDAHTRSLTVGNGYLELNPDDGEVFIQRNLAIGPGFTNNIDPAGVLHVVGAADAQDRVVFLPGVDTAAQGVPDIRVGIGTADPQGRLHVVGINDAQDRVVFLPGQDTAAAGTPEMRVGIGTAAPVGNLHVEETPADNSAVATQLLLSNSGGGNHAAGIGFQTASEYTTYGPKAGIVFERTAPWGAGDMKFFISNNTTNAAGFTAADERMRITQTGNVGIGTTAPAGGLDVAAGDLFVRRAGTSDFVQLRAQSEGRTGIELRSGSTGGNPYIDFSNDVGTDFDMRLAMAGNDGLRFSGGGVGINLDPITTTLEVAGDFFVRHPAAGSNYAQLRALSDGNIALELRGNGGAGTPYIDFSNDGVGVNDFDMRIIRTGDDALMIDGGNVGIGTDVPGYKLHVIGSGGFTGDLVISGSVTIGGNLRVNGAAGKPGNLWNSGASDAGLKKNIEPMTGALGKMLNLRGVRFEWKDPEKMGDRPGPHMGMVAQDVEKVFPEWVVKNPEGTRLLQIEGFEGLTVEALRELKQRLEAQEREIQALKKKLAEKTEA